MGARKARAAVMEEVNRIVIREFDIPSIGSHDALLKVEMAGVCSSDPKIYHGNVPERRPPMILGHEVGITRVFIQFTLL